MADLFNKHDESGAWFSDCRAYRYLLWREWDEALGFAVFIGLNPSTADESVNDPTIRRCIGFAKRWGYGGMKMLNLFGYRATDPKVMKRVIDPVGRGHDEIIRSTCDQHKRCVVAAWGVHGAYQDRAGEVLGLLASNGIEVLCLGTTADGFPRHPLYVKGDVVPTVYRKAA